MSRAELKAKAKQVVKENGGIANFCYKLFMMIMVSLCLGGIKQGKDIVVAVVDDFKQLKTDRDTDKAEHLNMVKWQASQEKFNAAISDSVNSLAGALDAHGEAIIDISHRLLVEGK